MSADRVVDEYAPDNKDIRAAYIEDSLNVGVAWHEASNQHDRWLWSHDARVLRQLSPEIEAWIAADREKHGDGGMVQLAHYRGMLRAAEMANARADRIEGGDR